MATESQVLHTSDLRSSAKGAQRVMDHKAKWARGGCQAPGKRCPHGNEEVCTCHDRPLPKPKTDWRHVARGYTQKGNNKTSRAQKAVLRRDLDANDLFSDPGPTSDGEADWVAAFGPDHTFDGTGMLGLAITQAVERFENKQTEKLAREYDIVDEKSDDVDYHSFADEDDFEVINPDRF